MILTDLKRLSSSTFIFHCIKFDLRRLQCSGPGSQALSRHNAALWPVIINPNQNFNTEFPIAKNQNTYAKRQREQEKKQRADEKRKKRDQKKDGSFEPVARRNYAFPAEHPDDEI